ncbi:clasp N terminal-domain-containing protein [Pilobolus umbonatus]|nr:clasp N terminal-domain-containing protein [Pilobolus umbonatus]
MTKEDNLDVEPIQIWNGKDLENEFTQMLSAFKDKESEFNWEAREKYILRLKGILRGNATEKYLDVLMSGMRLLIDGIVKSVESLRTQLAVKTLSLVSDIGVYIGKHLDTYIFEQLLMCMFRCSSLTKKLVASASLQTTITFISHASFYPRVFSMLASSIGEKNSQIRLYAVIYAKTVLQVHAGRENNRTLMDRMNATDHCELIITKGLHDPTPAVKEASREAFWLFWEYWRERGDDILRKLPSAQQKQLEKSKVAMKTRTVNSPTLTSLISPSNSTNSIGSAGSQGKSRAISPIANLIPPHSSMRNTSSISQMTFTPSKSTSPPPPTRKTRVPAISRKKSTIGLNKQKKAPSFLSLLNSEEINLKIDGIHILQKKLGAYPYSPAVNLHTISIETGIGPPMDGEALKIMVQTILDEGHPLMYEALSTWDGITLVMLRLFTFEEYIPKLILEANVDELYRRTENDIAKYNHANLGLTRAKLYLQHENVDLVDTVFTSLVQFGGFGGIAFDSRKLNKKDPARLPANRRKLTKQFLEWMDEMVTPLIGLNEDIDLSQLAYEGIPAEYLNQEALASHWFESDHNVRQCLLILLPLLATSASGTIWHEPLVQFLKHIRLLNQRLFERVTTSYDESSINKICRVLGVHIRVDQTLPTLAMEDTLLVDEENIMQDEFLADDVLGNYSPTMDNPPNEEDIDDLASPIEELLADVILPEITIPEVVLEPQEPEIPIPSARSITVTEPAVEEEIPEVNDDVIPEVNDEVIPEVNDEVVPEAVNEVLPEDVHEVIPMVDVSPTVSLTATVSPTPIIPPAATVSPTVSPTDEPHSVEKDVASEEIAQPDDSPSFVDKPTMGIPTGVEEIVASSSKVAVRENQMSPSQKPLPDLIYDQKPSEYYIPNDPTVTHVTPPTLVDEPSILASVPNPVKYPLPLHVPFFCPEKVISFNPIFDQPNRSQSARHVKDKTAVLYSLLDKLNQADVSVYRKLIRLFKEVPIRRRWDQGGSEESGGGTWAGGNGDGSNFVETIQLLIFHLDKTKHTIPLLECIRQLAVTQPGLFRFYERKLDRKGRTLESQLMEKLLEIRSSDNPTVCCASEDALDAVLGTLNAPTSFEMLMAFTIYRLIITPLPDCSTRYHPVGSAFIYLGKWVKELNDTFYIDEWMSKGGVNALFKGMNHPLVYIRKSCVEAIVAFHEVIGDDMYSFLVDLREDQLNLIKHYASKTLKKKASIRNLRDNNQF